MRSLFVTISCFIFLHAPVFGQHFLTLGGGSGRVIKHKKGLTFDIPKRAYQVQLGYRIKVKGDKPWHHFYGMPSISHLYQAEIFGDADVLGVGHALLRGLDFYLHRGEKFEVDLTTYTGLGYITRPFDRFDNPSNNAIGSHFNNATRVGTNLRYRIQPRVELALGAHILHFSNGISQSPNSGINTWGYSLEVAYQLGQEAEKTSVNESYILLDSLLDNRRRFFLDLNWQYSRSEHAVPGGPKYPSHAFSVGFGWHYHPLMSLVFGLDYEYRSGIYEFSIRDFIPKEEAKKQATRTTFFVAHDFRFNQIIFRPQLGYYLDYPIEGSEDLYIKLGTYYKFPSFLGLETTVGVTLKTHYFVAEYVAFSLGLKI